jgi:hypothetical protein
LPYLVGVVVKLSASIVVHGLSGIPAVVPGSDTPREHGRLSQKHHSSLDGGFPQIIWDTAFSCFASRGRHL